MEKKSQLINTAAIIVALTLGGKFLAFIYNAILASKLGTSYQAKAFTFSQSVTTMNFIQVSAAISTVLIPTFVEIQKKEGKNQFVAFANNVLNVLLIITMSIIIAINTIGLLIRNISTNTSTILVSSIISILILGAIFIIFAYVFIAILQSMSVFTAPALVAYPFNLTIILFIYFIWDAQNVYHLAFVVAFAWAMQAIILIPSLRRIGYRYQFTINFKDKRLKTIAKLIAPIIIITSVHQLNYSLDNIFSINFLFDSDTTALYYANLLYVSVVTVIIYGCMAVIYPKLSEKNISESNDNFGQYVLDIISAITLIIIPLSVGIIVLSEDIISFIYQNGKFDASDVTLVKSVLSAYAVGALGFAIMEVLSKTYLSAKKYIQPLITTIIIILLNVLLNTILIPNFSVFGISLATSIAMLIGSIGLFIFFVIKNHVKINKDYFINIIKILTSSCVMYLITYMFLQFIKHQYDINNKLIQLIIIFITTLIGIIMYFTVNILLKEKNSFTLFEKLKTKN